MTTFHIRHPARRCELCGTKLRPGDRELRKIENEKHWLCRRCANPAPIAEGGVTPRSIVRRCVCGHALMDHDGVGAGPRRDGSDEFGSFPCPRFRAREVPHA